MIKIDKTEVFGWEAAIRGMRNPMNSWEKSDSTFYDQWSGEAHDICGSTFPYDTDRISVDYEIGENDNELMTRLARQGSVHAKYRRMIHVQADITAPLYWWKEYDTYKVGTVANSCSTMHKIAEKEFTVDDFSHEHILSIKDVDFPDDIPLTGTPVTGNGTANRMIGDDVMYFSPEGALHLTIDVLNACREMYLKTNDKKYWWQMIQLLPSSYNQKRTKDLNYEVLAHMYRDRQHHKLDEWREFCKWIDGLPLSLDIIHPEDITLNGEA